MNNAFKSLGDFISGLTGLVMSLIGLGIVVQIAGFEFEIKFSSEFNFAVGAY